MNNRQGVVFILILLPIVYCLVKSKETYFDNKYKNNQEEHVDIVVLVHGAVSLGAKTPLTHFYQFKRDLVAESLYEKVVRSIRKDDFFYRFQPIKQMGLCKLSLDDLKPGNAAEGCAAIFDAMSEHYQNKKQKTLFYTFGWEGTFSKTTRSFAAKELYEALFGQIELLKQQGKLVSVTAIGYCHGAHVVLQMADVIGDNKKNDFFVDRVICLGMPLSSDIERYIASPLFNHIYHIFSRHDCVQPIDIFVSGKLVTGRMLPISKDLQKKVTQIDFRVFLHNDFIKEKPDFREKEHCFASRTSWRNRSPGHVEFWFFSWAPGHYRKNWLLAPFPALVYVPLMLEYITGHEHSFTKELPIIFDLRPEYNSLIIRQKKSKIPFIYENVSIPAQCKNIAAMVKPSTVVVQKDYNARVATHKQRYSA